jgi:hypothetical protein
MGREVGDKMGRGRGMRKKTKAMKGREWDGREGGRGHGKR